MEALAVDPAHPDRLYLALGTYAQSWAGNGAVLRSEDRGTTWTRTDLTVKLGGNEDGRGAGERLLVDPRDSDTLWLGTRHDGLLKSTDRGVTWAAVSGFPATVSQSGQGVTFLVAVGRAVYAGWGDGDWSAGAVNLYRTTDGATWTAVPAQPTGTSAKVPIRAAYDARARELYVTYADAPGPNGQSTGSVHKLAVADGTWREVTPVKPGDHVRRVRRQLRVRRSRRRRPSRRHRRRLHQQPLGGRRHPVPDHRRRPYLDLPQGRCRLRRVRDSFPQVGCG